MVVSEPNVQNPDQMASDEPCCFQPQSRSCLKKNSGVTSCFSSWEFLIKEPQPTIGLSATVWRFPVLRAAEVTRLEDNGDRIYARVEFSCFTKRKDGTWRELHIKGRNAPRLVLGVRESNLVLFKSWWSQNELPSPGAGQAALSQ